MLRALIELGTHLIFSSFCPVQTESLLRTSDLLIEAHPIWDVTAFIAKAVKTWKCKFNISVQYKLMYDLNFSRKHYLSNFVLSHDLFICLNYSIIVWTCLYFLKIEDKIIMIVFWFRRSQTAPICLDDRYKSSN